MASNDQAFKAGEAKGEAMEKVGQIGITVKDKATEIAGGVEGKAIETKDQTEGHTISAKDKALEIAGAAQDKAIETKVQAEEYAILAKDTAFEAAQVGKDKFGEGEEAAKAKAEPEKSGGVMQQIQGTAQGAVDAVKNTLGMGDQANKK